MSAAGGFERLDATAVTALATVVERYRHRASGARHVHLAREERHNAFALGFLTPPPDDRGVVHVLEHLTLCGSSRFPMRDAFFRTLHGSLATIMNARTSADNISYHFATSNEADFDHLLALFVDAAFFPLLSAQDFAREAHRLEFEQPGDPGSPLCRQGVVWNEMRGAMASPRRQQKQALMTALFPDDCYRFNPGGDPAAIPHLRHEDLCDYHGRYFCPANAVFMTAGPRPATQHQERFHRLVLARHEPGEATRLPRTRRFRTPRRTTVECAGGEHEETTLMVGWLLGDSDRPADALHAALLEQLLLGDGDAPLRACLDAQRDATVPTALCGLDNEPHQTVFGCGLQGVEPAAAARMEDDILAVVDAVARKGVGAARLRAALYHLALRQRTLESGRMPLGLELLLRLLPSALRGADPAAMLDVETHLQTLEHQARDPAWLRTLVRRRLLANPHRVTVSLRVDPALAERRNADDREVLREVARGLDAGERARLLAGAAHITDGRMHDVATVDLPALGRADIDPQAPFTAGIRGCHGELVMTRYLQPCNGVTELLLALDPGAVGEAGAGDLALLAALLPALGVGALDARATRARQAVTGTGFAAWLVVRAALDGGGVNVAFAVSARSLDSRRVELAALLAEMLHAPRLDDIAHLRTLLARLQARRVSALTEVGHRFAMSAAADGASAAATLQESVDGLRALDRLDDLRDAGEDALRGLSERLRGTQARLMAAACEVAAVSGDAGDDEALAHALASLPRFRPAGTPSAGVESARRPRAPRVRVCAGPVAYLARAWPTPSPAHADAAALAVLAPLVADGYLHAALRERGGAYGCGAQYDGDSATFRVFSYRDPRIAGTREDFDRLPDCVDAASRDARALERAVLRAVATSEPTGSPAAIAKASFLDALHGRDGDHHQRWRDALLAVDGAALRRVAEQWLRPQLARDAVLASARALAEAGLT